MSKNNLNGITYMRCIACLMVVFCHASIPISKHYQQGIFSPNSKLWSTLAFTGVGLFFIISGFLMAYIHQSDFNKNKSLYFLKKRFFRIAPMYYLATSITILGFIINPNWFPTVSVSSVGVILSSIFLPSYYSDELHRLSTILGVGWTLCFEAFFYLIFSLALNFSKKIGLTFINLIIILVFLTGNVFPHDKNSYLAFLSSPIILLFLTGLLFGLNYNGMKKITAIKYVPLILITLLFLYLSKSMIINLLLVNILFYGLINIDLSKSKSLHSTITLLGASSYSIYLFHRLFIGAFDVVISKFISVSSLTPSIIYYFVLIIMSVSVGIFIYTNIEKNIGQLLYKKARLAK